MAYSWQESVKPAGTQDIQCNIEYLDKSYIHVYLDGAETTAFTWTSSTNIRLNSPLSAETVVLLIRKTEREYLYIEFASGAPFIEGNVDTQNTQFLHLAQELVEGRSIEGFYGDINMHRYRITNLGDPVDARDAANKQYVDAGDARLDQRIDAEHAAWVAAVANEASIRKAADDALDVRTTNLEQTYFNANTNSFPWWTVLTADTDTVTPGMPFTKAKVRVNGVTQTAGYSYTVNAGVVKFAEVLPAGTLIDMTIGVDTDTDTSAVSSVLGLLGSNSGAGYIGTQSGVNLQQRLLDVDAAIAANSKLLSYVEKSIFEFMTQTDISTIKSTTGTVDVNYALKAAVSSGVTSLIFPPVSGVYGVGSANTADIVQLPRGMRLRGFSWRPYTVSGDSSFLTTGTTLRRNPGAPALFYGAQRMCFRDINFDGVAQSKGAFFASPNSSEQFNGTRLEGCGFYRFSVALGWGNYIATLFALRCSVSGCGDAVRNTIDSNLIGCVFNANARGVNLQNGANNNSFIACRNEWNDGDNYFAFNAIENIIVGELCDRAGRGGVVAQGEASWYVSNSVVRRSGAKQAVGSDYSANFVTVDNGTILLSGVRTAVGEDDGGGGTLSPSFCLSTLGAGKGTFIAGACDLRGFTQSAHNSKLEPNISAVGNPGFPDSVNFGKSQIAEGRYCLGSARGTLSGGAGTTSSVTVSNRMPTQYAVHLLRTLLVETRLEDGRDEFLKVPLIMTNETSKSIRTWSSEIKASTERIGVSSATGVVVSFSLTGTDDIAVTLTSVDGLTRKYIVTLLPS